MKSNQTLAKVILSLASLLTAVPALAQPQSGIYPIKGPVHVSCHGSQGTLEVHLQNRVIAYQLFLNGMESHGRIAPFQRGSYFSHGASASHIVPDPDPSKTFLSLLGNVEHKVLVPAHPGCLPSRVVNRCVPIQVPAEYQNVLVGWLDFSLEELPNHTASIGVIDVNLSGKKISLQSLGANTVCQVSGT